MVSNCKENIMIGYLKYLKHITGSLIKNYRRILSLAIFEYKLTNKEMFLGGLWRFISPFIQIGTYWLVFGIGIRQNKSIDNFEYVVWLTTGITAWFIISKGVTWGANSIYNKGNVIAHSNVPACIIPVSSVLAVILDGLWTIALMIVIYLSYGHPFHLHMLNIVYYVLYTFLFLSSLSFITSALVMLARDFQRIITMVLKILFFLSPVMWRPGNNMPKFYIIFHRINPIAYIINGFRDSLLYKKDFYSDTNTMLFFVSLLLLLYLIGTVFQKKIRNNILDYL